MAGALEQDANPLLSVLVQKVNEYDQEKPQSHCRPTHDTVTEEELQIFALLKIKTSPAVNLDLILSKNVNNKALISLRILYIVFY